MAAIVGRFRARAIGTALGMSRNNQLRIAIHLEIITPGPEEGTRVSYSGTFAQGKAFEIQVRNLRALGWAGTAVSELADLDENAVMDVLPTEVDIRCEADRYIDEETGEERENTKVSISSGGGFAFETPVDRNQAMQFDAMFSNSIAAMNVKPARTDGKDAASASRAPRPSPPAQARPSRYSPQPSSHPNAPGNDPEWMKAR